MPADELITRDALNRIEANAKEGDQHLRELMDLRFGEHNRRLADLNNSHERAVREKQRTDEAALQVQERAVTRDTFHAFKDEVGRRLDTQAGEAKATARFTAGAFSVATLIVNLVLWYLSNRPK